MPHRTASTLRVRLLLLVLLAVLPALAVLLSSAVERRREAAAHAQESAVRLAQAAAFAHQATIQETGLLLRGLAELPRAREGDVDICQILLSSLLRSYPRYLNFGVANPDTTLLCSVNPVPSGTPAGEGMRTALTESLRTGGLGVSGYSLGRVSGRPVIIFTQPVRGAAGEIRSVIYAALRIDWLHEYAARTGLPQGGTLTVVDPDGVVVVSHPGEAGQVGTRIADSPLFRRLQSSGEGEAFSLVEADGERYLHASTRLVDSRGATQAYLDVGIPARQAYAAADYSLRRNLLWLGVLAILALAAAWFGGDVFILRRVRALLSATRRLQAGDLSARTLVPPGTGELEQLARAFDEMAESLQARQRDAETYADTLRRQALLFDTLVEGVLVTDPSGKIVDWNPAAERMFGYSREDMLGRTPVIFHHRSVGNRLETEIYAALRTKGRWRGEIPFTRKDASDGISETVVVAHFDEHGERIAHIGVNRDVTERRAGERALRESEERFRAVFEHAPIGIAEGGLGGNLVRLNPAMQRFLDLPPECALQDLVGRTHPDDLEETSQLLLDLLSGERDRYHMEKRYVRPDGEEIWGILNATVARESDGSPRSIFALIEDITERKRTEEALARSQEELRHSQKMEAVGRLAGGVAHDFNNLLTAIKGNVEFALLDLPRASPLREDLSQIQQAADTASALTRQLLAFSSRQPREPRTVDVNATVAATAQMLRRMIGSSVELVTALEPRLAPIRIDPGQLEQILINFAVNASDAMPTGGRLEIATATVDLREDDLDRSDPLAPGCYVKLTVRDTGTGIEPELQRRIFEPFFTTKERERGTGLGLFTVYGIVTQSGGHVWVESDPGEGTAFHILLPCTSGSAGEAGGDESPPFAKVERHITVLLVDDEDAVRLLAQRLLQRIGYEVLVARDGEEALTICEAHEGPIHLLLTDITMPRMDGCELAERISASRPRIRVIFMSGYSEQLLPRDRGTEDLSSFVQKPFTLNVLAKTLRDALKDGG